MPIDDRSLIFATGAPGSRWSGYCRLLSCGDTIDNSDEDEHRIFRRHFGNYFGPSMEHGPRFHELDRLSRDEVLEALEEPFRSKGQGGRRLIKSHHFSVHLPLLREWFPNARLVLFHRENDACLRHWLNVGGFDIAYPRYDYYGDLDGMKREIAHQNAAMREFAEHNELEWVLYDDTRPLFKKLGMTRDAQKEQRALKDLSFESDSDRARFLNRAWEGSPTVAVF